MSACDQSGHQPALPVSLFGKFVTLAVVLLLDRPQIGTHGSSFLLTEFDGGHVGMDRRDSTF